MCLAVIVYDPLVRAGAAHRAGKAFALLLFPATKIIINNFH